VDNRTQMLYLFMLSAATPVGLEASGMRPQIRAIETFAVDSGWKITCRGRSGEEEVVRLMSPNSATPQQIDEFSERVFAIASRVVTIDSDRALSQSCDQEPIELETGGELGVLAFGPPATIERLKSIAVECGFNSSFIRQWRDEDPPAAKKEGDWVVLDAGEDSGSRYGPTSCFLNIGVKLQVEP